MKEKANILEPQTRCFAEIDLKIIAENLIKGFENCIKPALLLFGTFDDRHILKYIESMPDDMSTIYDDAINENKERVSMLEDMYDAQEKDFWSCVRMSGCKTDTPRDEGFQFKTTPMSIVPNWAKPLMSIVIKVNDRKMEVDEDVISQLCKKHPTQEGTQVFNLVKSFCDELNKMGIKNLAPNWLLNLDKAGNVVPNNSYIIDLHR